MSEGDDALWFGWRHNSLAKNNAELFKPIKFREHHDNPGKLYSKWKLRSHERWLDLDELAQHPEKPRLYWKDCSKKKRRLKSILSCGGKSHRAVRYTSSYLEREFLSCSRDGNGQA